MTRTEERISMPALQNPAYPAVMDHKLRRIRRRQIALGIVRGAILATAVLIVAMLLAVGIDWWFTLFHPGVRLALTATALAIASASLVIAIRCPLLRSLRLRRIADAVDADVPHLEERWSTVASLVDANRHPYDPQPRTHQGWAAAMQRQVTQEAVAMGRLVQPAQVARPDQVRRAAAWLFGAALLLAGFLFADWPRSSILVQRFWLPLSSLSATKVTSVSGDIVRPRGEAIDLVFDLAGLPGAANTLSIRGLEGETETLELPVGPDHPHRLVYHVAALDQPFRYRLQAGDSRTPWNTATPIDRPKIAQLKLTLTPPPHADRPLYEKDYLPQRLSVLQGSHLLLEIKPEIPLRRMEWLLAGPDGSLLSERESENEPLEPGIERVSVIANADGWYRLELSLQSGVVISPALLSADGLTNQDPQECDIRIVPDRAPVVRITSPTEELTVGPDQTVDVKFDADDDHGITRAELVVYQEPETAGQPPRVLGVEEIPLDDQPSARHIAGTAQLHLAKYVLNAGANLSFAVRVTDNRPPQTATANTTPPEPQAASRGFPSPTQPLGPKSNTTPPDPQAATRDFPSPTQQPEPPTNPTPEPTPPSAPNRTEPTPAADLSADPMLSNHSAWGQNAESNRLRLKIARVAPPASESTVVTNSVDMEIPERLTAIDRELEWAQTTLTRLWDSLSPAGFAASQVSELDDVEQRLGNIGQSVAKLREETRDTPYSFVGLQIADIASTHITPARDQLFRLIRQPDVEAESHVSETTHRVSRARELLAELLGRYERAVRERELADSIEKAGEMYEVYVANMHRLLRAQNEPSPNPLKRSMAIMEVDQEYLDRLREVLEMRRELMAEFSRMLADDPRLLSRYMDLIKRSQSSLRDELTKLHERQWEIADEVAGWMTVDDARRDAVWMLAAELRLHDASELARGAAQVEQRVVSQFPLGLNVEDPGPAAVIELAGDVAVHARSVAAKSRRLLADPMDTTIDLAPDLEEMSGAVASIESALDRLNAESSSQETAEYVVNRKAEILPLAQQVAAWLQIADHLKHQRYHGLAKVDQHQLLVRTEQLRIALRETDGQLGTAPGASEEPAIAAKSKELKQIIEAITFNQAAATFDLQSNNLSAAQEQQTLALAGFERAESMFDQLRRMVVEVADQRAVENPSVADLDDPTLDRLLAKLEEEPDLNALLGIPDRPSNLKRIADWMQWSEQAEGITEFMDLSARAARARAEQEQPWRKQPAGASGGDADMSEELWQAFADAEEAQEKLQKEIERLRAQADDPAMDEEAAKKLRQAATQLEALRKELADRERDEPEWQEMIQSEQLKAMLAAAAHGEPLPDSQWNQILSSLEDGLWQVQRETPPEAYREAIEQYQERVRMLRNLESLEVAP